MDRLERQFHERQAQLIILSGEDRNVTIALIDNHLQFVGVYHGSVLFEEFITRKMTEYNDRVDAK